MTADLYAAARAVLTDCAAAYRDSPRATALLRRHLGRLDEPVRVAVTGPPGIGCSTLVAALDGSRALRDTVITDGTPDEADAVLHLVRDRSTPLPVPPAALPAPVATIAVLCRTDELGAGRVDAPTSGRRLARRHRRDPEVRARCQTVVAVAGLVAHAGRTLTDDEHAALRTLAGAPRAEADALLLSADRFAHAATAPLPAVTRQALLDRLGLFGVRLATALARSDLDTAQLSAELVQRSGLAELREAIRRFFVERPGVLKARAALLAVDAVLRAEPRPQTRELAADLERVLCGAHELAELRLLAALADDPELLPAEANEEAQRLLGGLGTGTAERLGLEFGLDAARLWDTVLDTARRWQERADDPLGAAAARHAARVVVRSCEGMLDTASMAG